MNREEEKLLAMLDYALHQKGQVEYEETIDWTAVFTEARNHVVTALVTKALPAALPQEQQKPWRSAVFAQIASYTRYVYWQDRLCGLFSARKLPVAVLKGSAAAIYYPQPSLRAMGDIDIIVAPQHFEAARELLLENGYTLTEQDDGRHIGLEKNGLKIELHHRFSHREDDIEAYIRTGMEDICSAAIDGHSFPMLPRLANGIVLLEHLRSHLKTGAGLRQLIDWMEFVERELDDTCWRDEFSAVLKKEKMDTLAITATRACQKYLGLRESLCWCRSADDELCDTLMENLLGAGNFGRKRGIGRDFEKVSASINRLGFFRYLQIAGEVNWKALKKHPQLRPFAGVYQFFRYIQQGLTSNRGIQVLDDFRRGKQRADMLKRLNCTPERTDLPERRKTHEM